ncbi:MAG: ABC transporter ATP-binding protein [Planctomycetota bacterium]
MDQAAIVAERLGKRYRIGRVPLAGYGWAGRFANSAGRIRRALRRERGGDAPDANGDRADTIWALRDAALEIQPGEVVGIIGRNGAGKSTLLKILARIVTPTTGRAVLRGRVGSLLEVGTGFHPELTGRENIYLNGAILGMRRAEIRRRFDAIVDFAEIEKFLDTPVKRYSSGMHVRLAFAVAAHLEPEILLVDEVLAVGDLQFQRRCLGKMGDVARSGRTILFVSHNMAAVEGLCQRGIVLDGGRVVFDGGVTAALRHYVEAVQAEQPAPLATRRDREGDGRLRFTAVRFATPDGPAGTLLTGRDLIVELDYVGAEGGRAADLRHVSVSVPFFTRIGQPAFMAWTRMLDADFERLPPRGTIVLEIPRLPLRGGGYCVNLWAEVNGRLADWVRDAARFDVLDGDYFGTGKTPPPAYGMVVVDHVFACRAADELAVCEDVCGRG